MDILYKLPIVYDSKKHPHDAQIQRVNPSDLEKMRAQIIAQGGVTVLKNSACICNNKDARKHSCYEKISLDDIAKRIDEGAALRLKNDKIWVLKDTPTPYWKARHPSWKWEKVILSRLLQFHERKSRSLNTQPRSLMAAPPKLAPLRSSASVILPDIDSYESNKAKGFFLEPVIKHDYNKYDAATVKRFKLF